MLLVITDDLPAYGARINELVDSVATRMEGFENGIYRSVVPRRFRPQTETAPAPPPETAARGKKKNRSADYLAPDSAPGRELTPIFVYAYIRRLNTTACC